MYFTSEQVVNGLVNYADNEVMEKLPVAGKWVLGTALVLGSSKVSNVIDSLKENVVIKALDVVDDSGNIDVETVLTAMKTSADKYGKATFEIPMIGKIAFTSSDIDILKGYIG